MAELNPNDLPNPIRHGIAPAMKANPCKTFWGALIEGATLIQDKWLGVRAKKDFEGNVAEIFQKTEGCDQLTARELVQHYTEPKPDG